MITELKNQQEKEGGRETQYKKFHLKDSSKNLQSPLEMCVWVTTNLQFCSRPWQGGSLFKSTGSFGNRSKERSPSEYSRGSDYIQKQIFIHTRKSHSFIVSLLLFWVLWQYHVVQTCNCVTIVHCIPKQTKLDGSFGHST
jgi:hypothetical protein